MAYTYEYPRPALTVDAVLFRKRNKVWEILLIKRKNEPFKGKWALPGGFVDMDESLEQAIIREVKEETSLENIDLWQLHAFSKLGRDPRGHTVTVVFWGIAHNDASAEAGDDAAETSWFNISELPELAFDHNEVTGMAIEKLKSKTKK